jgi:hypothetical protein
MSEGKDGGGAAVSHLYRFRSIKNLLDAVLAPGRFPARSAISPSRRAHNRDTERPGCGREEAASGVRIVMRDNVSADRADPGKPFAGGRRSTRLR